MITVKLIGGLGNQLFQYAFGRSLSSDLNTELFFDLSHYDSEYAKSLRHEFYTLNYFKIEDINAEKFPNEIESSSKLSYYKERDFNEITGFPSLKNFDALELPAHFEGYWQTEKYFMHNEKLIRKDFQFKTPIKGKNKKIAKDISDNNAVAMHIRRGDYLNYTKFGTCSTDYYKRSVEFIEKQVDNPKFFIFSDDHLWVKENIHIPHPTYRVTNNDVENGHEDLRLMSLCNHFIIANSSFSWWGAWLSENKDKIVTTPQPWLLCRDPNLRYIDKGKHYYPIRNDHSNYFNDSKRVLFSLKHYNYSTDIPSIQNADLKIAKNSLNIKTFGNDSKLYLKEIQKFNDSNDALMKISIHAKTDGVLRLYYTTKQQTDYTEENSFYSYYYENEDLDIYVSLSNEILLSNLMIIPSTLGKSEINVKSLEIREIDSSNSSFRIYDSFSNVISKFRKFLPANFIIK